MKLRLHRPTPLQDLEVVAAVREAVGPDMAILVDANQNHTAPHYTNWSRREAHRVARTLDELDVFWLEEPLPLADVEGLAELCSAVDVNIAGAEHAATIYDFRDVLLAGAYDIVQPDVVIGHIGISGIRKVAVLADAMGRQIAPHVCTNGNSGLHLAATLQALGTVRNCPWLEYAFDPPSLVPEVLHDLLDKPLLIDEDGCVPIPQGPGIGVAIDKEMVGRYT
jgi:L-alanine-DL-glutamate epimerase-like enolase superfamily enzyme